MKVSEITSCYIGPQISPEQFMSEHFFLYLEKGKITGYDGHRRYMLRAGEGCLVRKNSLVKYHKEKDGGEFGKVVIVFDEAFLKLFLERHASAERPSHAKEAFAGFGKNALVDNFIRSLQPYYKGSGKIDETFADVKREELLLVLLKISPALGSVFFDFGPPEKIDLEAFMNRNYQFNVSIERFAYLTGRSLSAFKRDFKSIFNDTPNRWLIEKRLREAYFLIDKKQKRPGEIYVELGFEDLSHFSFAFKKKFGFAPTELINGKHSHV